MGFFAAAIFGAGFTLGASIMAGILLVAFIGSVNFDI